MQLFHKLSYKACFKSLILAALTNIWYGPLEDPSGESVMSEETYKILDRLLISVFEHVFIHKNIHIVDLERKDVWILTE